MAQVYSLHEQTLTRPKLPHGLIGKADDGTELHLLSIAKQVGPEQVLTRAPGPDLQSRAWKQDGLTDSCPLTPIDPPATIRIMLACLLSWNITYLMVIARFIIC